MVETEKRINKIREGFTKAFYYILKITLSLGLGYLTAQSSLLKEISPFSLILLTCCAGMGMVPTGCYLGSALGFLIQPFSLYVFKYITALTMIYVMHIVFGRTQRIIRRDAAITSGACCFVSGLLFLLVGQLNLFNILLLGAESVLVCCSVFFVSYAIKGFKKNCYLTSKELIAAAITMILMLISLHHVYLFQMSTARILGILIIFLGISLLKTSHVAVLGSCIGIILAAVSGGGEAIFTATIVGTLFGCIFSNFSERFAEMCVLIVYYATLLFFGKFPWNYWLFAEPMVAFVIAFIIPKTRLRKFLSAYIVVRTSEREKNSQENIKELFEYCKSECESFCPKAASCYQKYQEPMIDGLEEISERYNRTENIGETELYFPFCQKPNSMAEIITKQLIKSHSKSFDQLTQEFDQISRKIEKQMEASILTIRFLEEEEKMIEDALKKRGVDVKEINFIVDEQGVRRCEMRFLYDGELLYKQIFQQILSPHFPKGIALHLRHFGGEGIVRAVETEHFCITCAAICKTRDGEEVCGDKAKGFSASNGIYYLLLSDGMGSGRNAGIQSENTIETLRRLLLGGLSVPNAVSVLKSATRLRQNNSFSTLDICKIDLSSGQADFYKAGAYDSFCIKDNRIIKINGGGMPPGLSVHDRLHHESIRLADQSTLVMASDGLSLLGEDIEAVLLETVNEDARQHARNIHKRISDSALGISDDVTIVVAKFKRN